MIHVEIVLTMYSFVVNITNEVGSQSLASGSLKAVRS